jgi:hypothetical protein
MGVKNSVLKNVKLSTNIHIDTKLILKLENQSQNNSL